MIDPNRNSFWKPGGGNAASNLKPKVLLIFSILIGSCGQVMMKLGVNSIGGVSFNGAPAQVLIHIFTCPYIIAGLFCVGISMLLWLTVISKLELSFAYPIVALSYVIILLFGWLALSEHISATRLAGIGCIMVGVVLISRTENKKAGA